MTKFRKSKTKFKKYDALTPRGRWIPFGDTRYQHYKDSTPLKLYKRLDHNDPERRRKYRARHKEIKLKDGTPAYLDKEQASYYSWHFLW
jgi:hypothetical protein